MQLLNTTACALAAMLSFQAAASQAQAVAPKFLVVLDPGHGGADFGASTGTGSARLSEKHIALLIAQETARALEARKIRVALTREADVELPLSVRTAFANRLKADVFLSIHLNSSPHAKITQGGVETFILNNATDESSKRLAHLENSVLGGSPVLGDESSDVALILKDLRLDANLPESKRLACLVQASLAGQKAASSRGIKQALFFVLLGADMPSALLEAGFLNAAKDRERLTTPAGRKAMAEGLANAIDAFRKDQGTARARATLSSCQIRGH